MQINVQEHIIRTYKNSPEKIVLLNKELDILWVNNSFKSLLEILQTKFTEGKNISLRDLMSEYLHEDELIIHNIIKGLKELHGDLARCFTYEFPLYSEDSSYWMFLTACYQIIEDDEIYTVKIYDTTAQYKQRKLENKSDDNEIVRQIISESMHTWRQPLNSISLFTQDIKEQFEDSSLTKYYMNFATRQIFNEITRLSASIDEMAVFYSNDSDEDIINISETMFNNIERLNDILKETDTHVSLNCHALGDIITETFIDITENFKIRCGTGTKKCFHGCNKGNVVISGDKQLYQFLIRHLITLGVVNGKESNKITFEHMINDGLLTVKITYAHVKDNAEIELIFIKKLLENNFKGRAEYTHEGSALSVFLHFTEFKTKSPL
jgi:signal transduction histidine kinase